MKNKNGFNLVELMVAIGASVILGSGALMLMSNLQKGSKIIEQGVAINDMKYLILKAMTQPKHCTVNLEGMDLSTLPIEVKGLASGKTTYNGIGEVVYQKGTNDLIKMYNKPVAGPKASINPKFYYRYGEGESQFRISGIAYENLQKLDEFEIKVKDILGVDKVIKVNGATLDLVITYVSGEEVSGVNKMVSDKARREVTQRISLPVTIDKDNKVLACGLQAGLDQVTCDTLGASFYKKGDVLECRSIAIKARLKATNPPAIKISDSTSAGHLHIVPNTTIPTAVINTRLLVGNTQVCPTGATYCNTPETNFKSPVKCKTKPSAPGAEVKLEDCVLFGTLSDSTTQDSKRVTDYIDFWVDSITKAPLYDTVRREVEIQFMHGNKVRTCKCLQKAASRGTCTTLPSLPSDPPASKAKGMVKIPPGSYSTCTGPTVEGAAGAPGYFAPPQELDNRDCDGMNGVDGGYKNCTNAYVEPFDCTDVCKGNGEDGVIPCGVGNSYCDVVDPKDLHDIFKQQKGDLYVGDSIDVKKGTGEMDIFDYMTVRQMIFSSDSRFKTHIMELDTSESDRVLEISGVGFDWKRNKQHDLGIIAQDVEKYYPELVHRSDKLGVKAVETEKLIAPLINVIRENEKRIVQQKERIQKIKSQLLKEK